MGGDDATDDRHAVGAVWLTGLPGAGKSSVAAALSDLLDARGVDHAVLSMDRVRRELTPEGKEPAYSAEERDRAYEALVDRAAEAARARLVIVDATAHRRRWRDALRERVEADVGDGGGGEGAGGPGTFVEVHVDCPLEVAMEREAARTDHPAVADLYRRALQRRRGQADHPDLGEVIGVDVPYEAPDDPEVRVDAVGESPEAAARRILDALVARGIVGDGRDRQD